MKPTMPTFIGTDERGVSLPLVALSLITIMTIAAFGVDLAWFYVNSQRLQRAADAAALAGVVLLPSDVPGATTAAVEVATNNGYVDQLGDVTSGFYPQVTTTPLDATTLEVEVTDEVPTFFLHLLGMRTQVISERATAEYIPPLKLGSPFSTMGNDPTCFNPASPSNQCSGNFWIGIYGTYVNTQNGDAFGSACNGGAPSTTCTPNPLRRNDGYLFGIIPSTNSLTIQGLDPMHRYDGGGLGSPGYGDRYRLGDNKISGAPTNQPGPSTTFRLYAPDATPEVISDNGAPLCSRTYASAPQITPDQNPPFNPPSASWVWENICSGVPVTAGKLYVLQVQVQGPSSSQSGSNRFSLRVEGGNGQLFAIRDFSVYFNSDQATSYMYLAEVPDLYAGKTFVVEGFDPGDVGDEGYLQLRYPTAPGTWAIFPECEWYIKDSVGDPTWSYKGTLTPCQVTADNGEPLSSDENFQNKWFKLEATLDEGYTCGSDCWWQMWYAFPTGANPSDHVTWKAYVVGNPIHLIRNS